MADRDTRGVRDAELAVARTTCERDRDRTQRDCVDRRDRIRDHAREWLKRNKKIRGIEREQMKKGRMTASENDSLAEHNVEPQYLDAWREVRTQFSYDFAPDHRTELFAEWLQEGGAREWQAYEAELAEDVDWDRQEREHHEQQQEAVPF